MEALGPGGAENWITVVRTERVFQGSNDVYRHVVFAALHPSGHIAFPRRCVDITREFPIHQHLRDTPVPFGQRDAKTPCSLPDAKPLRVRNASRVERISLRVPALLCFPQL